jgi:hypothetical protein
MPAQAQAEITSNRQSIAGLLNKYNSDINIDLATANPDDIRTTISKYLINIFTICIRIFITR